ncbi:hypothetical protein F3Y22_tig00111783pilonHSYRG00150 [Hibiscus syriacus]|uniref:Uncharacterized protein n=1 Tax=Hibiscus syriacus TaxID=106335 RepID=A0A6A2Y0D2_HIBSY|nr:hypothetical protein F3Y22_tig00111783pilonHSYRG00150 [Hibiscus syriacus]
MLVVGGSFLFFCLCRPLWLLVARVFMVVDGFYFAELRRGWLRGTSGGFSETVVVARRRQWMVGSPGNGGVGCAVAAKAAVRDDNLGLSNPRASCLTDDPKALKISKSSLRIFENILHCLIDDPKVLKTSCTVGLIDDPMVLKTSCTVGLTDDPKALKTSKSSRRLFESILHCLMDDPKVLKTSCTVGLTEDPKALKTSKNSQRLFENILHCLTDVGNTLKKIK